MREARLRVCHIASGDGWGGAERVIALLVESMVPLPGVDVEVLLLNEGQLAESLRKMPVKVHLVAEEGRSFWELRRALRGWLSIKKYNVIHVHRYKEAAITILAHLPRIPNLVYTVHGFEPWPSIKAMDAVRIWSFLFAANLCGARFVAVSRELQRRLSRRLGASRVVRISNPVPAVSTIAESMNLRARLGWPSHRKIVGFAGRLERVKGPDLLLEIARLCPEDVGFVVLGSGPMEQELLAVARSQGLTERVQFLGHVRNNSAYLSQFDVLALTSRHEGLPMILLEAAAAGIPVVAFDVGGVSEVVDGSAAARLVRFGNLAEFASEVSRILECQGIANEATRWRRTVSEKFAIEETIRSYLSVYRSLVGGRTV